MKDKDTVIKLVRVGDRLNIKPLDTLPNFDKHIKVEAIEDNGFVYDLSETSDGKFYPFWAIKELEIVKEKL